MSKNVNNDESIRVFRLLLARKIKITNPDALTGSQ